MAETIQPAIVLRVHGLDCAEEVGVLRAELGPLVGGQERLSFDLLQGLLHVAPEAAVPAESLIAAVARTGMRAEPWEARKRVVQGTRERWLRSLPSLGSLVCLVLGFATHCLWGGGIAAALGALGEQPMPWLARLFYAGAVCFGSGVVLPKAVYAVRRLRPDMNLLMVLAVGGAIGLGEWFEAATVSFLFALSLALEAWSVGRARRALEALLEVTPTRARVLSCCGDVQEMAPERVEVGARVLVKPGERIPLDGEVLAGRSGVNQAPITGESMPVEKEPGDQVFAGSINGDGSLELKTSKPAGDSTLAHIIRLVEEARLKRAPVERWVERFARIYTPLVFASAGLVCVLPPLVLGGDWQAWLYRALVLLVIGCPCALVISTPVSIVSALAAAARNGVLFKDGASIEAPAALRAIAFDKTGTLSQGTPRVSEVVPLDPHDEDALLSRIAALETQSDHPLARAIVDYSAQRGVVPAAVEDFQLIQGRGATGRVLGREYWLGSHRYLEERGQETPEIHERLEQLAASGQSVVTVGNSSHVCGMVALADPLRPEAAATIEALRKLGIGVLVMLTGDNLTTARRLATQAGITEVHAELLPEDKVQAVRDLVERYGTVAMVGDGINDAPAMAQATLGIAMGTAGSDAAVEAADVVLIGDRLDKLPWVVEHSRRCLRIIRQNIAAALAVKAVFFGLTILGWASLWSAIAADMGTSLLVIANALRLLRSKSAHHSDPQDADHQRHPGQQAQDEAGDGHAPGLVPQTDQADDGADQGDKRK